MLSRLSPPKKISVARTCTCSEPLRQAVEDMNVAFPKLFNEEQV